MLSKEVQDELKAMSKGKKIEMYDGVWIPLDKPCWKDTITYRLDPDYKEPKIKKITLPEMIEDAKEKYDCDDVEVLV